jgi:hypothetical protein
MSGAGGLAQEATPAGEGLLSGLGLPELVVTATDGGFALDQTEVPAGRYLVTLDNQSSNPMVIAGFIQLPQGRELEDVSFADELAAGTPAPGEEITPELLQDIAWMFDTYVAGGASTFSAVSQQVVVNLPAGDYAVWDENPLSAMPATALTVADDPTAAIAGPEPQAAVTIVETGESGVRYTFDVQGELTNGPQIVKVLNASDAPHFIELTQYPEPLTMDQITAAFTFDPSTGATPPPDMPDFSQVTGAGWAGTQSIGTTQWVVVNPAYSQVLLACFIPDPKTGGTRHALEGMLHLVDVAGA